MHISNVYDDSGLEGGWSDTKFSGSVKELGIAGRPKVAPIRDP